MLSLNEMMKEARRQAKINGMVFKKSQLSNCYILLDRVTRENKGTFTSVESGYNYLCRGL